MRFHWFIIALISTLLFALPAEAGRLLFWRFESQQNRLIFTTDARVQPRALLIPNPTRIVIDLPGVTLGRPSVEQPIGGAIRSVRVGQFDPQTVRLVIELVAGYVVDPQQVKIRGLSPTQWTVELPPPQRLSSSGNSTPLTSSVITASSTPSAISSPASTESNDFQVTRNGLFIRLDRNGDNSSIQVNRNRDDQKIEFTLPGAALPKTLTSQTLSVNQYGVSNIKFEQTKASPPEARIALTVAQDSPNWQGYYSRLGGIVLLPAGGLSQVEDLRPPEASGTPSLSAISARPQLAAIAAIELVNNNSQLLIRADRPIQGNGNLNRLTGVYEIRIFNAQLAEGFRGPQLGRNSSIYQLRLRQESANTVVVFVQPSLGVRLGNISQLNPSVIALDIRSSRAAAVPPRDINVFPPATTPYPDLEPLPSNGSSYSRVLVIIDPGHGGKDPGAIGIGGLQEKGVVLPISLDVAQSLQQQGIRVMLTRNADYFVSLQGRTDLANRAGADIFVSIHANAVGGGRTEVNGLEVYYYGNRDLAAAIHRSILRTLNVGDRGVRRARFYVLRYSNMPAALVEVGFVTGAQDNPRLRDANYRRQMAQAIARGILEYIQQKRL